MTMAAAGRPRLGRLHTLAFASRNRARADAASTAARPEVTPRTATLPAAAMTMAVSSRATKAVASRVTAAAVADAAPANATPAASRPDPASPRDRIALVRRAVAWPAPAFAAWCLAWALHAGLIALGASPWLAFVAGFLLGALLATFAHTQWRRRCVGLGFPLSVIGVSIAPAAPLWLLPLALLALLYPLRSWRDAPLFPTPRDALRGLSRAAPLAPAARIVDLGCGVGDGLRELRREYPHATIEGIEWSWPLRWACALRCRDAAISRADIWAADWSAYDLVYLFQRPESMSRAAAKAAAELRPGAWLVSLEFELPGLHPHRALHSADGRRVWVYRALVAGG